ncbi:hypothetical protein D030_3146B, partial [Vibrio parahaemolyticus AQ3810]
VSPERTL